MKKQTYYKATRDVDKSVKFEEAQGYIIDLTDHKGYTVKIALECRRPYWCATLYESGVLCTPILKGYKSKDELIEQLKQLDFEKCIKGNTFLEILTRQLADFRNKN